MTETVDQLIQARFEAVANRSDDRDWSDVLARASVRRPARLRPVPARVGLAAAVVTLAAAVTAVAFGWPQTFIDFLTSPPAPANVKNSFGAENVSVPSGMSPQAIPDQARKITTATFDANHVPPDHPTVHTLYVAPRKGGGFCYLWTDYSGGCAYAQSKPLDEDVMQTLPDGTKYSLPRGWHAAQARKAVSLRSTKGSEIYLWLMPRTGGGVCFLYNRGGGCVPPSSDPGIPPLNGGLNGGA